MVAMSNTLDITGHTTNHLQDTRDRFSCIIPFCPIPKAMYPLDRLLGRPLGGVSTQFVPCWWRHRLHRSFRPNMYNSGARTVCQCHAQLLLGWETISERERVQNDPFGRRYVRDNARLVSTGYILTDHTKQITRSWTEIWRGAWQGQVLSHDGYYECLFSRSQHQMILRMASDMRIGFLVKQRPEHILSFCCLSVWRRYSVFKCYLI